MKAGDTFYNFGCKWIVAEVYQVAENDRLSPDNPFGLFYSIRIKTHVVEAPIGYAGVREMDTALK